MIFMLIIVALAAVTQLILISVFIGEYNIIHLCLPIIFEILFIFFKQMFVFLI